MYICLRSMEGEGEGDRKKLQLNLLLSLINFMVDRIMILLPFSVHTIIDVVLHYLKIICIKTILVCIEQKHNMFEGHGVPQIHRNPARGKRQDEVARRRSAKDTRPRPGDEMRETTPGCGFEEQLFRFRF